MLDDCKASLIRIYTILPENRIDGDFEYTPEEIDKIRAYFLLAHAEIETYIELCLSEIVTRSYDKWRDGGAVDTVLLNLIVYYHPAINGKDPERNKRTLKVGIRSIVEQAKKTFDHELRENNGVRSQHIEKMLRVCDFDLDANSALLPSLESFSSTRGEYAHNARSKNLVPPKEAQKTISQIISELDILEAHRIKLVTVNPATIETSLDTG